MAELWQQGRRLSGREWVSAGRFLLAAAFFAVFLAPLALVLSAASRVVSRHRELVADRGGALLTGSPAALASALLRLSGELEGLPRADLRAVAPRDPFHLLPAEPGPRRGLRRLWATHPTLESRLVSSSAWRCLSSIEGSGHAPQNDNCETGSRGCGR